MFSLKPRTMTAADLATAGFIDNWMRAVVARLDQLVPTPPPAAGKVVLYSVHKLAAVVEVHPDTVRAWLKTGKKGKYGQIVKLRAFKFTSEVRIPWPALLAYERGEDFDLSTLPAPLLAPPAELAATVVPPRSQFDTSPPLQTDGEYFPSNALLLRSLG
jgi:hypothetical protein